MDIVVAALATWQIIEIWHHSLLMAPLRSITEMWENRLGELLSCPFCLSPWVGLICIFSLSLADYGLVGWAIGLPVQAFAVARLANLGNDLFKFCNKTPKFTLD